MCTVAHTNIWRDQQNSTEGILTKLYLWQQLWNQGIIVQCEAVPLRHTLEQLN